MTDRDDPTTVRAIHEHAPNCYACGQPITDPDDAERVNRTFRVRHIQPCTTRAA